MVNGRHGVRRRAALAAEDDPPRRAASRSRGSCSTCRCRADGGGRRRDPRGREGEGPEAQLRRRARPRRRHRHGSRRRSRLFPAAATRSSSACSRSTASTDPELKRRHLVRVPGDVTTYTDVSGRLSEPVLNMHADPALYTQGQLLGFLLGGDPGGDPSSQARDEAATVGASIASAPYFSLQAQQGVAGQGHAALQPADEQRERDVHRGQVDQREALRRLPAAPRSAARREHRRDRPAVLPAQPRHRRLRGAGDRNADSLDLLWRKRW